MSYEIKISKNKNRVENIVRYLEACKAEEQYKQKRFEFMHKIY